MTTLRTRLLRIGEPLRSKRIRPWALAILYGIAAALLASALSPWLGLPVGVVAFFIVRRRVREGLRPISEDVRLLVSGPSWVNWALLILVILLLAWLLITSPILR